MNRSLEKDLQELIDAGVINDETSTRIRAYYRERGKESSGRITLIFGILGALLIGLGIILIIAHNWDEFSRAWKIVFALLPLFLGQFVCAYALLRTPRGSAWHEGGAVFLFFAIAASMSIVSQVYNIPGSLSGFLLTWMILAIPLLYVMRSAMTSLLTIIGITAYACGVSYFDYPQAIAWYYWLMLVLILPFGIYSIKVRRGNFATFHRVFLSLSLIITLGMFNEGNADIIFVGYMALFSLLVLIGDLERERNESTFNNAFIIMGSVGAVILLLSSSFRSFWLGLPDEPISTNEAFFASAVVAALAGVMLIYLIARKGVTAVHPNAWVFLIFTFIFVIGKVQPEIAQWSVNALVLVISVVTTWRGAERDNMFILNYGLAVMAVLIACRFFDTEMSFVLRGILFLVVGACFFGANYWVLKKRKIQHT